MNEIWKDIIGHEGVYQVSDLGRVKSLSKKIPHPQGFKTRKEKFLKPHDNSYGYLIVGLPKSGKSTTKAIHRLIAEAFIPNPDNKPEINHKDGNKRNNSIENLEWCTRSENVTHAFRVLGRKPNGTDPLKQPSRKPISLQKDGKRFDFVSIRSAAIALGVSSSNLGRVLSGRYKQLSGYTLA